MNDFVDWKYLIRALNAKQRAALDAIAIRQESYPHPKTAAKLVGLGLVKPVDRKLSGFPPVTVKDYVMPTHVHIAWCEVCSDEVDRRQA